MNSVYTETDESFVSMLEKLLRYPAGALRQDSELGGLAAWDSLAMIEFIAMVDSKYGIDLFAEDVRNCSRVSDLTALLRTKL